MGYRVISTNGGLMKVHDGMYDHYETMNRIIDEDVVETRHQQYGNSFLSKALNPQPKKKLTKKNRR